MKKLTYKIVAFTLLLSMLFVCGCADATKSWAVVELENYGTLKLPENWTLKQSDGRYYIFDDTSSPVMIQTLSKCGIKDYQSGRVETNDYYTIRNLKCLSSEVLSNGAVYGTFKSIKNDVECEVPFLELGSGGDTVTFVVDSTKINMEYLKQIAGTFVSK